MRPMIYLTVGGVVKVALNILFVGVMNMSVLGVALATIVSWALTAVLGVTTILRTDAVIKLIPSKIRL